MIIGLIKLVGGFVVSMSVGAVVENAVLATTPIAYNAAQRVLQQVGGLILSSMISEKAGDWVEETVKNVLKKQEKKVEPEVK